VSICGGNRISGGLGDAPNVSTVLLTRRSLRRQEVVTASATRAWSHPRAECPRGVQTFRGSRAPQRAVRRVALVPSRAVAKLDDRIRGRSCLWPASLDATTAAQKEALAAAKTNLGLMEQTRLLMSLQLSSPVAWPLIISVLGWSMFLFCGFGVLSGANPMTVVALGLGAVSVASAMFLILDLSQPYSGLFRVPATALQETIDAIDK
jgi:hypothetical protein